jgi:type IV pilus assembly protein PilQ
MNFLQNSSVVSRRAIFALVIISTLAFAVFAQKSPQEGCKTYGCAGFVGEPINLKVVNADIRDILNYITEQYAINFVIDGSVKQVPVTVNVNDVPWNVALDSILQSQGLAVQVNGTILRVADSKTLAVETSITRQIRDSQIDNSQLYTEFIRLNYARAFGETEELRSTTGVSTSNQSGNNNGTNSNTDQQGNQYNTEQKNSGLLPIIRRRLSRRGAIEVDERSNTLIITDVRENIDSIRQLVAILDQPEPQVEIETRIVVATRNFSRDVGVQLAAMVLGPRGSLGSGSTLPGSSDDTGLNPGGIPTGLGVQPNNNLLSSIPNTVIGLTTGIFGTAQISALITAGEQKGQAKIIATPRVTALNNRQAEISSGTQIPVTTIQPGSAAGGTLIATTEYINVPLRLAITPQITDAGTVVLKVVAENSSASAGGTGLAPAINTQSMKTEVTVPDGGTTVVGGVLFDDERENQDRTPGISKIPFLGNLFKRKGVSRNTNEILFFITPRIYRTDYSGNLVPGKVSDGNRTTTIVQPVPLGNPESNSTPKTTTPDQQQIILPVVPPTIKQP